MSVRFKESNPDFIAELLRKYTAMRNIEIAVGFPTGTKGDRIHNKADIPIWQLAAIHQFGSVARGIPVRDFMGPAKVPTILAIGPLMKNLVSRLNQGGEPHMNGFKAIARVAESEMKKSINNLSSPANAQSTVDRKGSSNPLIDSAEMRNATTAVVRKATT